jgi:hypothetical protein
MPKVDQVLQYDLDATLGIGFDGMVDFVIDKTNPDAIILDGGGGFVAGGGIGSMAGVQAVIMINDGGSDETIHTYSYKTAGSTIDPLHPGNKAGLCAGVGMQIGFGWFNKKLSGVPTAENYAEGTTKFQMYGIGAASITITQSYSSNGSPLWFTITAGIGASPVTKLQGGACWGKFVTKYLGGLYPCK